MVSLKRSTFIVIVICLSLVTLNRANAAVPSSISYQGKLTDSGGNPLNGTYSITFKIYADSIGGTALWSEGHPTVNVTSGLFSVYLGSTNPLTFNYFSGSVRYLGVKVGSDPEMSPRTRITSSPYSVKVESIDSSLGGYVSDQLFVDGFITSANDNGNAAIFAIGSSGTYNTGVDGRGEHGIYANTGVLGIATDASQNQSFNCAGIYGWAREQSGGTVWAGYFDGWVNVTGELYAAVKHFKIDDPEDPENRTLMHSCVESDEYKNIYDGMATLDDRGQAVITLPDWFGALNDEFRYQLTCVGGYAPVYIASEIDHNQFTIAGGQPGLKVSWQVTGVRKDAYALAHAFQVIQDKPEDLRGKYLHPKELGVSENVGVDYEMRKVSEERAAPMQGGGSKSPSAKDDAEPGNK